MSGIKITAALLLCSQAACSTFRRVDAPGAFLRSRTPETIMVTGADGNATIVREPRLLSDTVFGWTQRGDQVTIPLTSVMELRARQINPLRTALFSAAMGAIVVGLSLAVKGSGPETPEEDPEDILVPVFRVRF